MSRRLALVLALTGCANDRFVCERDEQCVLGRDPGHCELDGRCTFADDACQSGRRYAEHSGASSGACFADNRVPLERCAPGQPPALLGDDACIDRVCGALPSCCETGWSQACVQDAQLRCADLGHRCDAEVAVTIVSGSEVELWTLRWDGSAWSGHAQPPGAVLALLAPRPGDDQPRLARIDNRPGLPALLFVGDDPVPIELAARTYEDIASVDYHRDGRDKIVLGSVQDTLSYFEVRDLASPAESVEYMDVGFRGVSAWGDLNFDAFPDAVYANQRTYRVIENVARGAPAERIRLTLPSQLMVPLRYEWSRFTADGGLDLVVSGSRLNVHTPQQTVDGRFEPITNIVSSFADCQKPARVNQGDCPMNNPEDNYITVGRPGLDAGTIVVAAQLVPRIFDVAFATNNQTVTTELTCSPPPCPIFAGLAVHELDEGGMDIIAIDRLLRVWTTNAAEPTVLQPQIPLVGRFPMSTDVRLQVSGRTRR